MRDQHENQMQTDAVRALERENEALRQELDALRRLAFVDPLTGLKNRRYLEERLAEEIDRGRRAPDGTCFSLLVIDLDGFKAINDTWGHAAGDEALEWIARLLETNTRDHDICCRTGGDELTVLLPGADELGAAMLTERLHAALAVGNELRSFPVGMSIGSATWPHDGIGAQRLLELADAAMYRQKRRQKKGATRPVRRRERPATLPWGPSERR